MPGANSRFIDDSSELPREQVELGKRIKQLPPSAQKELNGSYDQVIDCVHRRRRILTLVQDALSQLRLDIKYLIFDVEATRRERDQLREQLDEFE